MRLQLRNRNAMKRQAHRVLDEVMAGIHHDLKTINWALSLLGEPVETKA